VGTVAAVQRFVAWLRAKGADPRVSEPDVPDLSEGDPSVER
jgi:hypothetical protein